MYSSLRSPPPPRVRLRLENDREFSGRCGLRHLGDIWVEIGARWAGGSECAGKTHLVAAGAACVDHLRGGGVGERELGNHVLKNTFLIFMKIPNSLQI